MGISPLSPVLDLVDAVPVDYMHTVLRGVVRMLLTRWFDSSYHTQPFYLGHQINQNYIPQVNLAVVQDRFNTILSI